jgi:transposase
LTQDERTELLRVSRSQSLPAGQVARATALLAVANGDSYIVAAQKVGRHQGDTIARWVRRFNHDGCAAVVPRHSGGPPVRYADPERQRILAEFARPPDRERDGTATWSLTTLQAALRHADDGLPGVSTFTLWRTLRDAGLSWQQDRTWCSTGVAVRRRKKGGMVTVTDADADAKKA